MRKKFDPITVTYVSPSWFTCWKQCDHCTDMIAKEPMFRVGYTGAHPVSPKAENEQQYCQQCAPDEFTARKLFKNKYENAPRPIAPPPPPQPRNIKGTEE